MTTKRESQSAWQPQQPSSRNIGLLRGTRYAAMLIAMICLVYLFLPSSASQVPLDQSMSRPKVDTSNAVWSTTPLEIHIMSKCPDAQVCLEKLILPTMQQVSNRVDFKLSFIGSVEGNERISCKHGPDECLGNIVELCAAKLYPKPKLYLGFTMCLFKNYKKIPQASLIKNCALEHGLDFGKLNECASRDDGQYGVDLLKQSFLRSSDANATRSCTVRLDNEIRCIRDGGEWKDCPGGSKPGDLIKEIMRVPAISLPKQKIPEQTPALYRAPIS